MGSCSSETPPPMQRRHLDPILRLLRELEEALAAEAEAGKPSMDSLKRLVVESAAPSAEELRVEAVRVESARASALRAQSLSISPRAARAVSAQRARSAHPPAQRAAHGDANLLQNAPSSILHASWSTAHSPETLHPTS